MNLSPFRTLAVLGAAASVGCVGPWDPDAGTTGDTGTTAVTDTIERHPRCTTVFPETLTLPVDPEKTFLIGTVFDHTLDTHQGRYRSVQLAVSQANGNDGLEGRDFAVIHCTNEEGTGLDELDKTTASVEAAIWLAETAGVPAIVGPAASSRAEAVYNAVADTYGTLVISPSATSPSLTPLDGLESTNADPGLFWRTAPPDDIQGAAIADDMLNHFDKSGDTNYRLAPSTNVAVIYQAGAYGEGLEAAFSRSFTSGGGTSSGLPFSDPGTRSDAIADAANGGFDEVLFASSESSDVIAFIQSSGALAGFDNMPLFLTDAARNADVLAALQNTTGRLEQVRGTVVTQPAGAVYDSFAASYAAEYAGEDVSVLSYTAQSFDAGWLVIMGHAWAYHQEGGEISGVNIARGLRRVSTGDEAPIRPTSWNLVKAAFKDGVSLDVLGASGELDYAADGETSAPIDVWTVAPTFDDFVVESTFVP